MGQGGSVHFGMLGIVLVAEPSLPSRAFCLTRHLHKHSNLSRLVFTAF